VKIFKIFQKKSLIFLVERFYCASKVYANTLMASLNSRITFVTSMTHITHTDMELEISTQNATWPQLSSQSLNSQSQHRKGISVRVERFTSRETSDLVSTH
jgi:hypothetical protein